MLLKVGKDFNLDQENICFNDFNKFLEQLSQKHIDLTKKLKQQVSQLEQNNKNLKNQLKMVERIAENSFCLKSQSNPHKGKSKLIKKIDQLEKENQQFKYEHINRERLGRIESILLQILATK